VSREGKLWIGVARGGTSMLDGVEFKVMTPVDFSENAIRWTSTLTEDASGAIWFGRDGTWIRRRRSLWSRWCFAGKRANSSASGLRKVCSMDARHLFTLILRRRRVACHFSPVGCFEEGNFREIDREAGKVRGLAAARQEGVGCTRGKAFTLQGGRNAFRGGGLKPDELLARLEAGRGESAGKPNSRADGVQVILEGSDGTLWLGTRKSGLYYYRAGHFGERGTFEREHFGDYRGQAGEYMGWYAQWLEAD